MGELTAWAWLAAIERALRYIRPARTPGSGRNAGVEDDLERKDWALLAISAAHGDVLTPVQLQKSLFVLGERCKDDVGPGFYTFDPYDYGPFCVSVYTDAEALADAGLVELLPSPLGRWSNYRATDAGMRKAERLRAERPNAVDYLRTVVEWARSLTFGQLVRAIYAQWPEMKQNSVFQE